MPTFLVFKDRREVARIQGADPKALEAAVKNAVSDVTAFSTTGGRTLGEAGPASTAGATAAAAGGKPVYLRNGQATSGIPFAARVRDFLDAAYVFLALYFISLLSFDPYAAAEESSFNQKRRPAGGRMGWGGFGGGAGGGGGGGSGGPGGPPRKLGRVGGAEDKGQLYAKGCA